MSLAIYGTGGHAKSIYNLIRNKNKVIFFDEKNKYFKVGNKTFVVNGGIKKLIVNKKK